MRRLSPIIFILVGLGFFTFSCRNILRSIQSEYWPTVNGTITSSEMQSHHSTRGGTSYSADISYDYEVDGSSFSGGRVSFGQTSSSQDSAQEIVDRYPIDEKVQVHYSPGEPEFSVLEPGIHHDVWLFLTFSAVFMGVGAFLFIRRT